ncbi:MAG: bifunctional 5,10-methylenetetrahydrofolate dehydrogenase/5,10-methenyltetrahydrofolate cyclohydrolase [Lachnospiraceae bacterium]|nr:bifunctional 5,10-methylenetetrahydrofolate dehydrogenase/5,10-methenyltetrahydrofolate cyclohydrolase [Lachnospiraceae bacterium]
MPAQVIDGKAIAQQIKDEQKARLAELGFTPTLVVIKVGNDQASEVYVRNKTKACEYVGIRPETYNMAETTSEDDLLKLIDKLNKDKHVDGILVQLPLPGHIDSEKIINSINPDKDVDGFNPINVGKLVTGDTSGIVPCTPAGIIELLKRSKTKISGANAVVIGRSNIVGKPVAALLLRENATVTVCHSKTPSIKSFTKFADIVISAVGQADFLYSADLNYFTTVIDVGINRDSDGKLCGDCHKSVYDRVKAYTPVPGGVGPMTVAMLMKNTIDCAIKQRN